MTGYKYERKHLLFYDQEMLDQDLKRLAQRKASTRPGTQQSTQSAQELETQARRENSLATKVADPKLKGMIRNSATGKV